MRVVIRNGRRVVKDPTDYDAMSEIMWCSSVSHNGLTGLGGEKDFSAHQLGQAIGGIYDKAHGATLSAVWEAGRGMCLKLTIPDLKNTPRTYGKLKQRKQV